MGRITVCKRIMGGWMDRDLMYGADLIYLIVKCEAF